jgi:DNA topoisomerase-2
VQGSILIFSKRKSEKMQKGVGAAKIKKSQVSKLDSSRGFDVNERYSKKSYLEHVLLRPDTYVGGTDKIEKDEWIILGIPNPKEPLKEQEEPQPPQEDEGEQQQQQQQQPPKEEEEIKIVQRKISYSPALYKIFDEIIVNARDQTIRDKTCNKIRVDFNRETGEITVENNGTGIPIEWHDDGNCYLPELIFGVFKSGENFSDSEKKIVGGRNGIGSKCSNAFSQRFQLDIIDKHTSKRYMQTWEKNMSIRQDPVITSCAKAGSVKITFLPDYNRLGRTQGLEDDLVALLSRRVYDIAACTLNVRLTIS